MSKKSVNLFHNFVIPIPVKKSSKDVDIENMLKLYEEVWLSKVFELQQHSRLVASNSHSDQTPTQDVSVDTFNTI